MTAPTPHDALTGLVFVGAAVAGYIIVLIALWLTAQVLCVAPAELISWLLTSAGAILAGILGVAQFRKATHG